MLAFDRYQIVALVKVESSGPCLCLIFVAMYRDQFTRVEVLPPSPEGYRFQHLDHFICWMMDDLLIKVGASSDNCIARYYFVRP